MRAPGADEAEVVAEPLAPADSVVASIDWFEFSIKSMGPHAAMDWLEEMLGAGFGTKTMEIDVETERKFFARGPNGVRVSADFVGSVNRHGLREPWVSVCLPGTACRTAGSAAVLALLQALASTRGVKVSRLDVALDDLGKQFSPRKFAVTCVGQDLSAEDGRLQRCVVTRVRGDNWNWDRRMGGCFWLGGAKSERRLRVYDKERESDGQIKAVRCELQCRDRYATVLASAIVKGAASGESLAEVTMPFLLAFVDLRKPAGPRSQSHLWPRIEWWERFVGCAEAAATAREDLTHVLAWERNCSKQGRGFASVQLRVEGLTPGEYRRLPRSGTPEAPVVRAMDAILNGEMPALSKAQQERMRELREVRGALAGAKNPH